MSRKPLVSIIIVNWNGGDVFRECLKSLKKIKYQNYEVIIVDNGSSDGTEKFANIRNKKNLGFAEGNNLGFEKTKGEYILLLNNDTNVDENFLSELVKKMESDQGLGVLQPKIKIMSDPKKLDTVGSFFTATGFLQHVGYLENDSEVYDKERIIFSAKGACMLIRREIIDRIGLFDQDFGSYFEETDFCWRVWLLGYKILYFPKAEIYHKVGFTSKRQNQIEVNYNSFKNRITTLFKNLDNKNLILIGLPHIVIIFGLSAYYFLTLRIAYAKMIWKALYWNIKNFRNNLRKRKFVQRNRTKSDRQIFKYILAKFDFNKMTKHFLRSEKMFAGKHEV